MYLLYFILVDIYNKRLCFYLIIILKYDNDIAYLAISFLKQTPLQEKQLRIFLSYLQHEPLKKYLYNTDIYKGKRNMSKIDLIDMIIIQKSKKIVYSQEDDELSKEGANNLLKNNSFTKKELKENTIRKLN